MDRNQVIGFSLLGVLLVAYLFYNNHEQKTFEEQKRAKFVADSLAHPRRTADSLKVATLPATTPSGVADSATEALHKSKPAYFGEAKDVTFGNKKITLKFSTRGAFPVAAMVNGYKTYFGKPLNLFNGAGNQLSAILPFDNGKSTADLYYTPVMRDEPNGDKTIDFTADLGEGKKVDLIYTLPADDFMMRCSLVLTGMTASSVPLTWQTLGLRTEKDITNERMNTQVYYRTKSGDNDYFTVKVDKESIEHTDAALHWAGFRKQYFSAALINDDGFGKMDMKYMARQEDTNIVAQSIVKVDLPLKPGNNSQSASFKMYIGPNDYHTLRGYGIGMDEMVPLGVGPMAFVKYVNKFAIIPLFYFLQSFIGNIIIIIILMTVFIRLLLSFFTYKSFLSSAKMRVMKPELDELRLKCGDDQQKFSMEQMKLYKSVGVNPLGGCLPMLFQLPILLAMYYLFPSFIEFRQQHFLWADDLSTYDSVLNFGFTIPWYGDHVSLFTLLFTLSSLFVAIYNRNMTPQDPNNPMMKYLPFIFPVILMGMFNKMAAALTFYYTVSNLLSMLQQFIIQKYFIDEKAIHAQLQENKTKPPTPSKWAAKLEEMQKLQADRAKQMPRKSDKK